MQKYNFKNKNQLKQNYNGAPLLSFALFEKNM